MVDVKALRRRLLEVAILLYDGQDRDEEFFEFVSKIESIIQQAKLADDNRIPVPKLDVPDSLKDSIEGTRQDLEEQGVDVDAMLAEHKKRVDEVEAWYYRAMGEYSKLFKHEFN